MMIMIMLKLIVFISLRGGEVRWFHHRLLRARSGKVSRSLIQDESCQPRNEFAARAKGISCVAKCLSDNDCQNKRKLCLCDGICGMSCIRPEKECPELPDPPNGQVHLTGRHFQDRAVYTCDEGYQIVGVEKVVCQTSGQWSGEQPTCKHSSGGAHSPYYCGRPPTIENASHNGSGEQTFYDLDAELTYQCFPGFRRERGKGFDNAKCFFMNGTASWYGPDLHCSPIDCGPPQDIIHGVKKGDCMSFRCQITYDCQPGFQLVGGATKICQADGTWTQTELPTCIPVQSDVPANPVNGKAIYTAVAYKSVVSYECKYGFMIVGNGTRMCGTEKKWSGSEPRCEEINCGKPNNGVFPNGFFEGSQQTLNAVIRFQCVDDTMTFEGETQATCQANGTWSSPVPKCLAPCIIPQITEGVASGDIGKKVPHGDPIEVNCTANYEVLTDGFPITCNNGTWSKIPRCSPARCKTMPTPPRNGMVVVPQTGHGAKGLFQCKDGYTLLGNNMTECVYGNWTGKVPSCKEMYCPFPGTLTHGKILLVGNMGLYDYRPYVRKITNDRQIMFDCDKGYKLAIGSAQGATCVDGVWSPSEIPVCLPGYHPTIKWLENRRKREVNLAQLKREARQTQRNDTKVPERRRRRRDANGKSCPSLDIALMQVSIVTTKDGGESLDYRDHGSTVNIDCNKGYTLSAGKSKVRCRKGEWKPQTPIWQPSPCEIHAKSPGAIFTWSGVKVEKQVPHGSQVDLKCRQGFYRLGPDSVSCSFGVWSVPVLPYCKERACTVPDLPNGHYREATIRAGSEVPHDTLADYTCEEGLVKPFAKGVQCKGGEWVPGLPVCTDKRKARAQALTSSDLVEENQEITGEESHLPCELEIEAENLVAFQGDEMFDAESEPVDVAVGERINFRCVDIGKFHFEGKHTRTCIGGRFDSEEPKCVGLNQALEYS